MLVQYAKHMYSTVDWSMTGLGILDFPDDIEIGQKISIHLILPIAEASVTLKVEAICKNKRGNITGFEFHSLPESHKRVLRHYVELSLDGRLDNLEDLISDFTVPEIETPIKEALNLTEEEQVSLLRKFRSRAFLSLFAGVLLVGYLVFTLMYNYIFMYKTIGVVSGDLMQINAGVDGYIKKHYVKVGDAVHVNDIIFDLDDSALTDELRKYNNDIERQQDLVNQIEQRNVQNGESILLQLLREEFLSQQDEYDNANDLFENKVISIKDYVYVKNNYKRAQINYLRELEKREFDRRSFNEKKEVLNLQLEHANNEKKRVLNALGAMRVKSPVNGNIFTVNFNSGEYVTATDVVVTLATRKNPFVLFKMPSKQSGRTQLGMLTKIYSFETEQTYEGKISSIGYSAINPRSTLLQEVSLEQTVIKVDIVGENVTLPLNSRVEIWVQKQLPFVDSVLEKLKRPEVE